MCMLIKRNYGRFAAAPTGALRTVGGTLEQVHAPATLSESARIRVLPTKPPVALLLPVAPMLPNTVALPCTHRLRWNVPPPYTISPAAVQEGGRQAGVSGPCGSNARSRAAAA